MSRDDDAVETTHSLRAYGRLVCKYAGWRTLWIGEILSSLGNWFGFVATLLLVEQLAQGRGILLSVVLIMRFLPSFFLFPIAGVVADRYDRVNILIASCLVSAVAAALLPVVKRPQELWLLYTLLFIEFSASAFYDPARRALTPSLVSRPNLHLATTIDSFAWSLTGALGASLGGLAASRLSVSACLLLDALTYVFAAACNYRLRVMVAKQTHVPENEKMASESGPLVEGKAGGSKPDEAGKRHDKDGRAEVEMSATSHDLATGTYSSSLSARQTQDGGGEEEDEAAALLKPRKGGEGGPSASGKPLVPDGCWELVTHGTRDELASMREGWQYAWHPANRDVLLLTLLKGSGSLIWGASDVLNVRFSELPSMQGLGDAAFTLGLFFASVGLACLMGPIIFNAFTPPRAPNLLLSAAFCSLWLMAGYVGMALATNVFWMCLSIIVKSFGSATMWVYSTLLLQLRVPDSLLGRTMALEMAFFTVAESVSGLFGGFALDDLGLTIRQVACIMAGVSAAVSCFWLPYSIRKFQQAKPRAGVAPPA